MKICPTCQSEYPDSVDFCPSDGMKLRSQRGVADDPLVGTVLDGRWIIEEKIGEGGMGAVYKGHQKSVNRRVAVKTLRPALTESDEFVDRFFREARIATRFNHPNCVTILDFGQADESGVLYLAMEFLDGMPLSDRMIQGGMTVEEIVKIGIQISSALAAAHNSSIVHRDLKPDNIFLVDIGVGQTHAKVLDFGIAKALDSKTQVTKTGMIFGTPEYMSPEQCRGTEIDGRSDLYSLGCILYELIGGRTPFSATTPMAILLAHVNDVAAELKSVSSTIVPPSLNQIVMKLLEKDPANRYPDAATLQAVLERELASLENPGATVETGSHDLAISGFESTYAAEPLTPTDQLAGPQTERPNPTPSSSHDAPKKSRAGLYIGLLLAGIAIAAVAVVMVLNPAFLGSPKQDPVANEATEPEQKEEPLVAEIKTDPIEEVEEPVEEPPTEVAEIEKREEPTEVKTEQPVAAVQPTKKSRVRTHTKKKSEPVAKKDPVKEKAQEVEKEVAKEVEKKAEETKENAVKKAEKKVNKEAKKVGDKLNDALDSLMSP